MDLEFRQHNTIGLGWEQHVIRAGRVIGRIRQNAEGVYEFYRGPGGTGSALVETPMFTSHDLEQLKANVWNAVGGTLH